MGIKTKFNPLGGRTEGGSVEGTAKVVCSNDTTWYLDSNGDLYGAGNNEYGQQGLGDTEIKYLFVRVATNVKDVACSQATTWYVDNDGGLYGCGEDDYGNQGNGSTGNNVLTFTQRASNVVKVACSRYSTWYIDDNGDLYGYGYNNYGQQGNNDTSNVKTFTKRASNVASVACSNNTTWYINSSGDLYGCGGGSYGQQGNRSTSDVTSFTKRASNVASVACSQNTTWYLTTSGDLYGCGVNTNGQQGSGDTSTITTFTKRATNVKDIACSQGTTWYINNNGDLYGCGNDDYAQQGGGKRGSLGNVKGVAVLTNRMKFLGILAMEAPLNSYTTKVLEEGNYFLQTIGSFGGYSYSRSAYASTFGSGKARAAHAKVGAPSGAAFVGHIHVTGGYEYEIRDANEVAESTSLVVSQNTATVSAINSTTNNRYSGGFGHVGATNLEIKVYSGSRGYTWADYNSSPYYTANTAAGGTISVTSSDYIQIYPDYTLVNSAGNAGQGTVSRITSASGSTNPIGYSYGASVYEGYGAYTSSTNSVAVEGFSRLYYCPYAVLS